MTQLANANLLQLIGAIGKKIWAKNLLRWWIKMYGVAGVAILLSYLMAKKKEVKDKVVLITGGAGGLGKALATEFAQKGAKQLILWDLNTQMLADTQKELQKAHPHVKIIVDTVDISSREIIYAKADALLEQVKFVDVVVNNAGILGGKSILEQDDRRIQMVFDVNVMALFWMTKKFLPSMMAKNDGHIVVVSSLAGIFASPLMTDYSASKFAAKGFTDALRLELAKLGKSGVKTLCVCPAAMKTDLFKGFEIPGMPSMKPSYVAGKVVQAIKSQTEMIILPWLAPTAGILNAALVPVWMFDLFNKPAQNTMAHFDGSQANKIFSAMESNRMQRNA